MPTKLANILILATEGEYTQFLLKCIVFIVKVVNWKKLLIKGCFSFLLPSAGKAADKLTTVATWSSSSTNSLMGKQKQINASYALIISDGSMFCKPFALYWRSRFMRLFWFPKSVLFTTAAPSQVWTWPFNYLPVAQYEWQHKMHIFTMKTSSSPISPPLSSAALCWGLSDIPANKRKLEQVYLIIVLFLPAAQSGRGLKSYRTIDSNQTPPITTTPTTTRTTEAERCPTLLGRLRQI